jgi:hypothetical protein
MRMRAQSGACLQRTVRGTTGAEHVLAVERALPGASRLFSTNPPFKADSKLFSVQEPGWDVAPGKYRLLVHVRHPLLTPAAGRRLQQAVPLSCHSGGRKVKVRQLHSSTCALPHSAQQSCRRVRDEWPESFQSCCQV